MALYRLVKVEWEKQLRPLTEAFKVKTGKSGKRKRSDKDDGEEGDGEGSKKEKREEFPGGGRKGISSGLGLIVRRNGVRVDNQKPRNGAGPSAGGQSGGSGLNWWEEDAA